MRILEVTMPNHPDSSKRIQQFGVFDNFRFDQAVITTEDGYIVFMLKDGREVLLNKNHVMAMIYFDVEVPGGTDGSETED